MSNEVETCETVINAFDDVLIIDVDFSDSVREVAQRRGTYERAIEAAEGERGLQLKSTTEMALMSINSGRKTGDSDKLMQGIRVLANSVGETRIAVCDSCAAAVIGSVFMVAVRTGWEMPIEWMTAIYNPRTLMGHSFVVVGRPEGSDVNDASTWEDAFIVDLWWRNIGFTDVGIHRGTSAVNSFLRVNRKEHGFASVARFSPDQVLAYGEDWMSNPPRGLASLAEERRQDFNVRRKDKKKCYITTATCQSLSLPDDCDELQTLRWFRDNVLLCTPEGTREVAEYYEVAPGIVERIDRRPDAREVYQGLLVRSIRPAVEAVRRGQYETAHSLFKEMVLDTRRRYLDAG